MTSRTSRRAASLSDERKLALVSQTLHEIRGDTKWIRENGELLTEEVERLAKKVADHVEGSNSRIEHVEDRFARLEKELGLS